MIWYAAFTATLLATATGLTLETDAQNLIQRNVEVTHTLDAAETVHSDTHKSVGNSSLRGLASTIAVGFDRAIKYAGLKNFGCGHALSLFEAGSATVDTGNQTENQTDDQGPNEHAEPLNPRRDVFPTLDDPPAAKDGDEGFSFFSAAAIDEWVVLGGTAVLLCLLDWFVFRRLSMKFFGHLVLIGIWVAIAAVFNVYVYFRSGSGSTALEWCTGYLLEWMLSMDNLFVFHLVFSAFKTPSEQIHKAVFVGIIGAVGMRMLFFMLVSTLLHVFGWFRWPFGLLLLWSGVEAARAEDEDEEDDDSVKNTRTVRALKWMLGSRLHDGYDEKDHGCFFKNPKTGEWQATILLVVIVCLEFTDILFALDSVSAKIAQIPDQYIAFSSSVLAMFGLRAMFFVIKDLVAMFDLLKYGLCLILVFIGAELMFSKWLHLSSSTVCLLIIMVFIICIAGSHARKALVLEKTAKKEQEAAFNEAKAKIAEYDNARVHGQKPAEASES